MRTLIQSGPDNLDPFAIPVVALAHNEANILCDFLDHYRALGPVTFLIVDDNSTDGTSDILSKMPDVTVFRPAHGSSYKEHKAIWRSELLDTFADERWCLVPDLDEHFVFAGAPDLLGYISQLDEEGASAVATLMIDMYTDRPLADHLHPQGSKIPLRQRFQHFDGPEGYAMRPVIGKVGAKYPTPPVAFHGGPRHRMNRGPLFEDLDFPKRTLLCRHLGLSNSINADHGLIWRLTVGQMARRYFNEALNMTKVGLLRWQRGMRFNGGAHKLNRSMPVSESIAGFLHYPFTRGAKGIRYVADRGQHVGEGKHYRALLESGTLAKSFAFDQTRIYQSVSDLTGLIRPIRGNTALSSTTTI
ncbi:glycosyltransferase family 2 protein [uncultured Marivita sp.]|uniref:glycosyltransferase family 2 protein n=1 Tax=uncultured Marivita sp. TaxID=888080 RepID=UPI002612EDBA|nr:glycosyltransferase family 2 protein [uncultured Marivita sp.]